MPHQVACPVLHVRHIALISLEIRTDLCGWTWSCPPQRTFGNE
jgi:hypothetical protein